MRKILRKSWGKFNVFPGGKFMCFFHQRNSPTHRLTTLYPASRSVHKTLGSGQSEDHYHTSQCIKRKIYGFQGEEFTVFTGGAATTPKRSGRSWYPFQDQVTPPPPQSLPSRWCIRPIAGPHHTGFYEDFDSWRERMEHWPVSVWAM